MSPRDDFPGEMEAFPFDETTADSVFGAVNGADSAPEELRDVAELVQAARRTGSGDELAGADVIVARIAAAMGEHATSPQGGTHERIPVLSKFRTTKVTAATAAVLLLGGTAAAAATGSLPTPVHHHAELAVAHTVASPRHQEWLLPAVQRVTGTVASVNGVTTSGTCGAAGLAGTFTVTTHDTQTFTVNVGTTTAYAEEGVASPSFANVCVGSKVKVDGTFVDSTVTASTVTIKPPHVRTGAMGMVASVNGVSTAGTCGVAGLAGTFTLTAHENKTFTVNVDPSTAFTEKDVTTPTFANVCVGEFVAAKGTVVDPIVTATQVFISPAKHDDGNEHHGKKHEKHHEGRMRGASGMVVSVNGVTTDGSCGASGTDGTFTIAGHKGTTFTINVTGTTTFKVRGVTDATFANVCVGAKVGAKGDTTDTTVAATDVFVFPAHSDGAAGSDGEEHHDGDHHGAEHHGSGRQGHKGDRHGSK